MKRLIFVTLLTVSLYGCGQTTFFTSDKSDAFARIETSITAGSSRARVVELMGTPAEVSYGYVFGVSHERLTFKDGKCAYTVVLVHSMTVSKFVTNLTH